jgi:hypothetical protein
MDDSSANSKYFFYILIEVKEKLVFFIKS